MSSTLPAWTAGTWLSTISDDVWEEEIVPRVHVATLLSWPDVPCKSLSRAAGEAWRECLCWTYVTSTGPCVCVATNVVEMHDVALPHDWTWVHMFRFFCVTPYTTMLPESVTCASLIHLQNPPLLHLHRSWLIDDEPSVVVSSR